MRLHTDRLLASDVMDALDNVKNRGRVGEDVQFEVLESRRSRSHYRAYEVRLGSFSPKRRPKNTGKRGSDSDAAWRAASWDEWGWFMAEVYRMDQFVKWGSTYHGRAQFNRMTTGRFMDVSEMDTIVPRSRPRPEYAGTTVTRPAAVIKPDPVPAWDKAADPIVFGA